MSKVMVDGEGAGAVHVPPPKTERRLAEEAAYRAAVAAKVHFLTEEDKPLCNTRLGVSEGINLTATREKVTCTSCLKRMKRG